MNARAAGLDAERMRRNADAASRLLRTLSNPKRLLILCVLHQGEMSVGELNQRVELSQSALSQHLALLREQELVQTRRESQTIYYRLSDSPALELVDVLYRIYCGCGNG